MFVLTLIYVEHHQASKPLRYWMLQGHSFTDQELLMCLSVNGGGESVTWFSHLAYLLLFLLTPFPISWTKKMLFKNIKLCNVHKWTDFISAYISYNLSYYEISWVLSSLYISSCYTCGPNTFLITLYKNKKRVNCVKVCHFLTPACNLAFGKVRSMYFSVGWGLRPAFNSFKDVTSDTKISVACWATYQEGTTSVRPDC